MLDTRDFFFSSFLFSIKTSKLCEVTCPLDTDFSTFKIQGILVSRLELVVKIV